MKSANQPLPSETDVLIVGAGPTGMALAIALQQEGIDHVLIDKLPEGLNTSRAGVIHAHTLEELDRIGVAKDLVRDGMRIQSFCIRDRNRPLLQLDFSKLPSAHPYLLMLPQDQTERILRERLTALGGVIYRNVTAAEVHQDASAARVSVTAPGGNGVIRAKYVVGADGMHSVVRAALGTEFEGGTYEDSFVLADVKMDWALGTNGVTLLFSPAGMVVIAPLPNDRYRVVATTAAEAPEHPSAEFVQQLLDTRGPNNRRSQVKEVLWSSRFRLHHRVAKSYRNGRLLLMGDAAHVHSPAGGQGMNTGLVDAVVLGQLLPQVIRNPEALSLLDKYQELRRPAASKVVAMAGRLTDMATAKGLVARASRNLLLSVLNVLPPARQAFLMNLSGLSRRHLASVPATALNVLADELRA